MSLTYEELQQLNDGRRKAKEESSLEGKKRIKLREKLETALANWGGEITVIETKTKPRPERITGIFDDEYCGAAKVALILRWLDEGEYNNGRRARLADFSGVPLHRIYNLASVKNVRLTNREYNTLRKAMRKVEELEKRSPLHEH